MQADSPDTESVWLGTYVVNKIQNEMQQMLMDRILTLKCCESDKALEGELFNRLEFDADTIVSYYIDLISSVLMIVINLVVSLYFVFHISARLSGMVVIAIPVLYMVNFVCRWHSILIYQLFRRHVIRYLNSILIKS